MNVTWRKNMYPAPILEQFDPSRFTMGPNGKVSYQLRGFDELHVAGSTLFSFLDLSDSSASAGECISSIVRTIMEAGASDKLNPRFFLSALNRRLSKLETRPNNKYVAVGYISVAKSICPLVTRRISGVAITIGANIGRFTRQQQSSAADPSPFKDTPPSYSPWKLTVTARSDHGALSLSHRTLHLLLGWWNHALTYGRSKLSFGGRPGPVAEIILAPLRVLYTPSGKAANCWSYDPDFGEYPQPLSDADQWGRLQKAEKAVRDKLWSHKHKQFLDGAFRAYYTACSCHMLENAFLSLWTLLETLTGTDQGDKLIRRTLFPILQKHREFCRWELQHLQHYRNCYVHRGDNRPDIQRLVYQLKKYVDVLLKWWLFNFSKLGDKQEVFDILDTPNDRKMISHRLHLLKKALQHAQ